jgi:hypothetical protein
MGTILVSPEPETHFVPSLCSVICCLVLSIMISVPKLHNFSGSLVLPPLVKKISSDKTSLPKAKIVVVHHSFLENMRYGIHRRRLKPAAIYS